MRGFADLPYPILPLSLLLPPLLPLFPLLPLLLELPLPLLLLLPLEELAVAAGCFELDFVVVTVVSGGASE